MAEILKNTLGDLLPTPKDPQFPSQYNPKALMQRVLIMEDEPRGRNDDKDRDGQELEGSASGDAGWRCCDNGVWFAEEKEKGHGGHGCKELSALVTCGAHKTKDFGQSARPFHIQSYTETNVEGFAKKSPLEYVAQNTRMLSRIYPKGSRINSSNYSPMLSWSLGAQVVALNFQTWDEPLKQNAGFFAQNGGSGYVQAGVPPVAQ